MRRIAAALALLLPLVAALPARADCIGDIATARARVARETDIGRKGQATKLLNRAQGEAAGSEVECRNDVTRAWRILRAPAEEKPKDRNQPNYMPAPK